MKVLHINKRYPPHVGGIERHVQVLARGQAARSSVEVEVVVAAEGVAGVERDQAVRVRRVPEWGTVASNPLAPAILRVLGESDHDVWHFHYPFPTGEAAFLLSRKRGKRAPAVVCTYHSDFVAQSAAKRIFARPYAWLTRGFLGAVDAVVTSSPQLAAASRFLPGVASRITIVPFGIDPAPLAATPDIQARAEALRREYGRPVTLFVGRLVRYKGVDVLLRALPFVPGILVLVGDGPQRPGLEALARALGVAARVRFVGSLTEDDLVAHYHCADVFALPSVSSNEAFGLVQLEAHACGLPVVSTALPTGVPFANRHGETGLVVTPGDPAELAAALALLLENEALRRDLGARARARVQREFTTDIMVARILELYAELLAERRTVPAG